MITLITILIILASGMLAFFILIQAPKGGGLTGNFGSLSTQVMGVKQSTDVMEKGTWTSMGIIAGLCIITVMFIDRPAAGVEKSSSKQKSSAPASAPSAQPAPGAAQPK